MHQGLITMLFLISVASLSLSTPRPLLPTSMVATLSIVVLLQPRAVNRSVVTKGSNGMLPSALRDQRLNVSKRIATGCKLQERLRKRWILGFLGFKFPDKIGGNLTGVHYIRDVADADSLIASLEFILSPLQFGVPYSRPRYFRLVNKARTNVF